MEKGEACLQEPHPVLDRALGSAHAPEDASKDDGARHVAHGPPNVGGLVPADLAPAPHIADSVMICLSQDLGPPPLWLQFCHCRQNTC